MKFLPLLPFFLFPTFLGTSTVIAAPGPRKNQIKSLVTFGDSFTDIHLISNGGTQWPVYVASPAYANVTLYPYARSGATCSNKITFRPFPSVFETQLPDFFKDKENGVVKVGRRQEDVIYSLWIGTNDLGVSALLTGQGLDQENGKGKASIVDVAECMVNWVKVLYESGARNFLFQNVVPLEKIPLYSANSYPNRYWHIERNTTAWSDAMREQVLTTNLITKLLLTNLAPTLRQAHIALFDSHGLFTDIHDNPGQYLNGTRVGGFEVDDSINRCVFEEGVNGGPIAEECIPVPPGGDRDSFLWFDELHPSEQSDRIVAREVANTILGKESRWVTWLS